ncbi:MAG: hypothetical protein RL259_949, partial [Bacteroidota bacterium]
PRIQPTHRALRKTAVRRKVPGSKGGVGDEYDGGGVVGEEGRNMKSFIMFNKN